MSVNANMQLNDLARSLFAENCSNITNNYQPSQIKRYMKYRSVNCTITGNNKTYVKKDELCCTESLSSELQDNMKDNWKQPEC